jgi:hypothetical protein
MNTMSSQGARSSWIVRVVAELAVIFMGVSAAFVVDKYREDQQDRRRAQQLVAALYADLRSFSTASGQYVAAVRAGLAQSSAARAEGRRPVPYVLRVPGAEGPPVEVWETAMQSGAGEVIDPDLVIQLAAFYHEIAGQSAKYVRYAQFTEQQVWPVMAGDTTAFYDARTGELKPPFAAHRRQLEEIIADLESAQKRASALADRLAARYPTATAAQE